MYPLEIIAPMKEELTAVGFKSLTTKSQVIDIIANSKSAVLIVNSVCGCAAANARPGVKQSLENDKVPKDLLTVFAGVDKEATSAARALMIPFPPSSPSIAVFKNGELVHMLERHHIEGRSAEIISENLKQAYNEFCN
jgi:putative YphP/YqiW family bacilliredoxin|tara:strand:+ start:212 stop:625 length:414 start_codon:yes stop_codon:yes gene_type:complete